MRSVPKQYLTKYSHKNDVEKQCAVVLGSYPGLSPSMEKYYYPNGTSKDLIALGGTIPIKFKGASYNIPVSIHIPDNFPYQHPIVYVKPTNSMAVRSSHTVDPNGLVKLPYLLNWNSRTHSLVHVVKAMVHDFSNCPPVFAKTAPPQQSPQQYPGYNPYPQNTYGQQVATPPYPAGGIDVNRRTSDSMMPPPYPPPYGQTPGPGAGSNLPYPANPPAYGGQFPSQPSNQHTQPQSATMYGSGAKNDGQIDPIKASLLTAIAENLSRRISNAQEMAQKDLDSLNGVQAQLKSNRDHLEMTVGQLEQQIAMANSHLDLLQQKKLDIESAIEQVQQKAEVTDIDDCISPSCPLYKQLLNLYAEECAIEDTTYYLDKALMDNVVDLETYLKNVRALSRKQFMVRAQMQKARQVAGLKNITPH